MIEQDLVRDLIVAYAIGLASVLLLGRLRVPSVIAMILAGAMAGPAGLGALRSVERVDALAEIGVVLLLFTVGLDFSVAELQRIWKPVVIGGTLQVAGTAVLVAAALVVASQTPPVLAGFVGVFVAMSSTAIVLRGLADRGELNAPHGRLMVGVLLYQDLAVVSLLLLVPMLAPPMSLSGVPAALLRMTVAFCVVAVIARLVLPWLFRLAIASNRRDAFSLAILLASVGTAWLCSRLGVSTALGAFLGGLALAESEFSHQVYAEIRPLRDVLTGLFFISVGMLLDWSMLVERLPLVALAVGLAIVAKSAVAGTAVLALGTPLRVAVMVGLGLAQVGEFSFILGRAGLAVGLLTEELWQVLLAFSIVTMVMTPALLRLGPALGMWLAQRSSGRASRSTVAGTVPVTPDDHVVIVGFGLGGQTIARTLRDEEIRYVILELNGATVRRGRADGEPIYYGDGANRDALEAVGVSRARAVVLVLSDPDAARRAIRTIRAISRTVPIIVRTRYRLEAEGMQRLGATVAIAEEIETSLEVLAQLLARLHVPSNRIEAVLESLRHESTLRALPAPLLTHVGMPGGIQGAPVVSYELDAGDWAAGRTLAETTLRSATGASIVALQHESQYVPSPPSEWRFAAGDVVYLLGERAAIRAARLHLKLGPQADGGAVAGPR